MVFSPDFEPHIIEEHGGIVAVFKPQGWHSTAQAHGHGQAGDNIVHWMSEHGRQLPTCELTDLIETTKSWKNIDIKAGSYVRPSPNVAPKDRFATELGMLYRLDFATSGILLFALSRQIFKRMMRAQERSALVKRYVLVCTESNGKVPGSLPVSRVGDRAVLLEDIYNGNEPYIGSYFRGYGERGARVACIAPEHLSKMRKITAKNFYETRYTRNLDLDAYELNRRMSEWSASSVAIDHPILIGASIRKGFRHQIRAHSAWVGLPIVGDSIYGGAPMNRLMLEAYSVALMQGNEKIEEWKLR